MAYLNDIKITNYNSAGSFSWTKDTKSKFIRVIAWNSGAGGGSGRRGLTTASGGGGGAAGGGGFIYEAPSEFFPSSATVVVGAGGLGGAVQTSDNTNGINGSPSNASSFGNITGLIASAGFGAGGVATNATPGSGQPFSNSYYVNNILSPTGGTGRNIDASNAVNLILPASSFNAGSGGGGSGADSVIPRQAGTGSGLVGIDGTTIIPATAGGIETGTVNGSDGIAFLSSTLTGYMNGGAGGGGGGGMSVTAAGKGGNGGFPGGGGGGGGGSLNSNNSGAGGNGADGKVIIIEYM